MKISLDGGQVLWFWGGRLGDGCGEGDGSVNVDKGSNHKDTFSSNTQIRLGISNTHHSNAPHSSSLKKAMNPDFRAPYALCQTLCSHQGWARRKQ